jgi:hypothetical protein
LRQDGSLLLTTACRYSEGHPRVIDMDDLHDDRAPINRSFDPKFCGRVCRIAAIVSLALTLGTAALLTTLQSPQCPGWMIPNGEGASIPVWLFLLMTGLAALVPTYYALTWKRFARRMLDEIRLAEATFISDAKATWHGNWDLANAMSAAQTDYSSLFVGVSVAWVLFTAVPLILTVIKCF